MKKLIAWLVILLTIFLITVVFPYVGAIVSVTCLASGVVGAIIWALFTVFD